MTKNQQVYWRPSVGEEIWPPDLPLLNPAFLWSGAGAGRVKKSNERSGAGGCRSGSGTVSGTIVNEAER